MDALQKVEIYKAFGSLLRDLRMEEGVTQQELADEIGQTRTAITNIEKGSQTVSLHQIFQLAAALHRQPSDLLPEVAEKTTQEVARNLVTARNAKLIEGILGRDKDAARRGEGSGTARPRGRNNSPHRS